MEGALQRAQAPAPVRQELQVIVTPQSELISWAISSLLCYYVHLCDIGHHSPNPDLCRGCSLSMFNVITFFAIVCVFFLRDDVRAPIPQKQDILVEPEPLFGGKNSASMLLA